MPTSRRFNPSTDTAENTPPPNSQFPSFTSNQAASHPRTLKHLITQAEWQRTEYSYIPTHTDRNHGRVIPRPGWDFHIFEDPPTLTKHIRFGDVPRVERSGKMQRPRPRPPTPPPPRPLSYGSDGASTNSSRADENYHGSGSVTVQFPDPNRSQYLLIPTRAPKRLVRFFCGNRSLGSGQLQPVAMSTVPVRDITPSTTRTTLNTSIPGEEIISDLPIRPKTPSSPSATRSMNHTPISCYMHTGSLPYIPQLQLDDYYQEHNSTIKIAQTETTATAIGNNAKTQVNANGTDETLPEATNPQQQQSSSTNSTPRIFGFRKSKSTSFFFAPRNWFTFSSRG